MDVKTPAGLALDALTTSTHADVTIRALMERSVLRMAPGSSPATARTSVKLDLAVLRPWTRVNVTASVWETKSVSMVRLDQELAVSVRTVVPMEKDVRTGITPVNAATPVTTLRSAKTTVASQLVSVQTHVKLVLTAQTMSRVASACRVPAERPVECPMVCESVSVVIVATWGMGALSSTTHATVRTHAMRDRCALRTTTGSYSAPVKMAAAPETTAKVRLTAACARTRVWATASVWTLQAARCVRTAVTAATLDGCVEIRKIPANAATHVTTTRSV